MFLAAGALAATTFAGAARRRGLALTFLSAAATRWPARPGRRSSPIWWTVRFLPQAAALNGVNMNLARAVGPASAALSWRQPAPAGFSRSTPCRSWHRRRAGQLAARRCGPTGSARAAGRGPAGGRTLRPARVDRATAAVPGPPVHPRCQRGLGTAPVVAAGTCTSAPPATGCCSAGRDRRRGGRAGHPTATRAAWARPGWSPRRWWSPRPPSSSWPRSHAVLVGLALVPIGGAWIAVMSSLNSGLQLALPSWVRARGLAYYLFVFQGAQAARRRDLGGGRRPHIGHHSAVGRRRGVGYSAPWSGYASPMPDTAGLDRTPSAHWPAPQLMFTPDAADGPSW